MEFHFDFTVSALNEKHIELKMLSHIGLAVILPFILSNASTFLAHATFLA